MPKVIDEEEDNNNDLIAMNSPSSSSQNQSQNRSKTKINDDQDDLAIAEQRAAFEEKMALKESQGQELDKMSKVLGDELKQLQSEVRVKRESEEQMKQVLKEYEKTISELIAEKEREKATYEEDKLKLCAERDQATEDLKVRKLIAFVDSIERMQSTIVRTAGSAKIIFESRRQETSKW